PALRLLAGLARPVVVIPGLGPGAVLAGQGGHNVDVVRGMPHRHPPQPPGPRLSGRARSGASPVPRPAPTPHPTTSDPPGRRGPRNATPACRSQDRRARPVVAPAARRADGSPAFRPGGVPAPIPPDHQTRQPGADRYAHSLVPARTGSTATGARSGRGALSQSSEHSCSVTEHSGAHV